MRGASIYQLFSQVEGFSDDETWFLRREKDEVFEWLRRLSHLASVMQTMRLLKENPQADVLKLAFDPDYEEFYFYWNWSYGCLDVNVNIGVWNLHPPLNEYRVFRRADRYSNGFAIYATSQVENAIRLFFPCIRQKNKMMNCDRCYSLVYANQPPSICRQKDDEWLCKNCFPLS